MDDVTLIRELNDAATRFEQRAARGENFATGKADICRDMIRRFHRFGFWASARQRSYAEALVRWSHPLPPREQARAEQASAVAEQRSAERAVQMSGVAFQRIAQLFAAAAAARLGFPKIRLQRGEWKIIVYPAPRSGRNAGSYYVKARSATSGASLYCGVIRSESGEFNASQECPLDVIEALREFSTSPERVAAAYGHAHGHCCFCGRGLTDARSVAMGYGPVCAQHFGLEWGEERARSAVRIHEGNEPTVEQLARAAGDTAARRVYAQGGRRVGRRALAARVLARREVFEREQDRNPPVSTPLTRPTPVPLATPQDPEDEDSHFM